MNLKQLQKIITPFFKGNFCLPTVKDPKNKAIHIVGVSSGIDSTATALCLRALYPEISFRYIFTDTGAEVDGTLEALDLLEAFLGKKIKRLLPPLPLLEHIKKSGNFLPSQRQRSCTSYSKIYPMARYMRSLEAENNGQVEIFQYVGIRADEPTREGADISGISNNFPLQSLGLNKEDVNKIVNHTVGIPVYYMEKSRSGCFNCIFSRKSEVIESWKTSPEKMMEAANLEGISEEVANIYLDAPLSVAKEIGMSRNWISFIRPDWLGYKSAGAHSTRGKNNSKTTLDMFSEESKHLFCAVEYQFHEGIPGMSEPIVFFEKLITYSTSLGGLKTSLKHFWLHRLNTEELHDIPKQSSMDIRKQIAIIQIEVDDYANVIPEKSEGAYVWQNSKTPLLAIKKSSQIIEHILLCAGVRQDGQGEKLTNITKEWGRVLNFSEYKKPKYEDLVDDMDIEDAPIVCNSCSR